MGRVPGALLSGLLVAVVAAGSAGCSREVEGSPTPAPPVSARATGSVTGAVTATGAIPGAVTGSAVSGTPTADSPRPTVEPAVLQPDVLADECLLDAAQVAALLGHPVRTPEQSVVQRDDGGRGSLCYAGPADGAAGPAAAINVYRVRTGTPAQFVRAARGRVLTGAGAAATVLDTAAGPTLQVAGARFLVTVAVQDREPDDPAWRAAARAVLARLPR